jgi:hypothetical protein
MEQLMPEWGVFNDEGCVYVADTAGEAADKAEEYRQEDGGYYADLISVHVMCPDHRDQEQPKNGCEECSDEGCGAVDPTDLDACGECRDCSPDHH